MSGFIYFEHGFNGYLSFLSEDSWFLSTFTNCCSLCSRKLGCVSEIKIKFSNFYFVFLSTFTTIPSISLIACPERADLHQPRLTASEMLDEVRKNFAASKIFSNFVPCKKKLGQCDTCSIGYRRR